MHNTIKQTKVKPSLIDLTLDIKPPGHPGLELNVAPLQLNARSNIFIKMCFIEE